MYKKRKNKNVKLEEFTKKKKSLWLSPNFIILFGT